MAPDRHQSHGSRSPTSIRSTRSISPSAFAELPQLACQRASPRPCVNHELVQALKPLRDERFLLYGTQTKESISYATAISCIIGCPLKIETVEQAKQLHKVGAKLLLKIEEWLKTGRIQKSIDILKSPRYIALKELTTLHGLGPKKANELYDSNPSVRTIEQLKIAEPGRWDKMLQWHDDLQLKMPRSEAESILEFVRIQLERIEPGAHMILAGSYRRGKTEIGDVDILVTYPHEDGKERNILTKLIHRLEEKGLIPEDGCLQASMAGSNRTTTTNKEATLMDSLDRAFVIFRLPANTTTRPRDIFRRVDIVVSCWASWGSAVVGWTGSTQFERDLRQHAQNLNIKFDSGGMRDLHTSAVIPALTEKDVFRVLKLDYIPPHLRWADP
ncbi:hypothetical protein BCR35DRAFT_306817 [Leucosporidium creatinivorum]|uniref:DNA polymerase n=1 Tax=Leucosporidium creatinivorum TaxID=106004 RepID=A0A1Y2ER26_9BASI|nr:hypothetical protein BCR35DRAFT_306817 [Leucosporidium creatinivorum]